MLNWLIGTLFMAFPLLLPIFILMIARKIGYRWPAQRLFMRVALAFYAISLVLIGGHAAETGLGLQEFFNAYYGAASDATLLYYLGLACQILAIVALMFVVNWKVIRLYYGEDWKAPAGFMTKEEAEKAAREAELEAKGYVAPNGQPAKLENVRCACETFVTTGTVIVAGEIRTEAYIDVQNIAREVIRRIGYDRAKFGFDCDTCGVLNLIHEQSPDIAQGVDESFDAQAGRTTDPLDLIGAGDQGMMFGYASNETPTLMPMPHYLSSRLAERLAAVRHDGTLPYLRPDGKTQVTVRYEGGRPVAVETIVISTQHAPEIEDMDIIEADMREHVIAPVMGPPTTKRPVGFT